MADYRRWYIPGGTYFFTVVSYRRQPLFHEVGAQRLLGQIMREVRELAPFETVAICLLHDHLHCLWTLPSGDEDYPCRWRKIKSRFTERWLSCGGQELPVTPAKQRRGQRGIWQPRFWEHTIRDEDDLEIHADHIHYNPVKHGYCGRPWDWPASTFRRYVRLGQYDPDWGDSEPPHLRGLDWE